MKLAAELNTAAVDVVSLQHEFGLYGTWGDPYDDHLTGFLEVLRKPLVTTLHSVLRIRRQPYARRLSASGGAAKRSSSRPSGRARCSSTTTFFTRLSYYTLMAAVAVDGYSADETTSLVAEHGHPGPWNAKRVPPPIQFEAYLAAVRPDQDVWPTAPLSLNVGRKR